MINMFTYVFLYCISNNIIQAAKVANPQIVGEEPPETCPGTQPELSESARIPPAVRSLASNRDLGLGG